jgi:hypothetical protein
MLGSLPLQPQPTARETREIAFRLGHELTTRGAHVRHDIIGGFRFNMPVPWRRGRLGALHAISWGKVTIGAGSGEPWRVRYDLRFTLVALVTLVVCAGLVRYGLHWPRTRLINLLLASWLVFYGIPCALAMRVFQRLVRNAAKGGD